MKAFLTALLCCSLTLATLAFAQGADEGYQMGKVVAFEKIAANAQHMENSGQYKISMRLTDTIYNCTANGDAATFLDWTVGKQFPTKLNGKELMVKNPNGEMVVLKIAGKKQVK
ncbi:MAG TPA: hypothetical protein VMB18_11015 [Terriglobales bacterium]|jgi:hypothetical protein|nr:hypothetical protein [Terriglobales bacterium]